MRTVRRVLPFVLAAFALFSVVRVVQASFFGSGHGPVFWTAIAMLVVLALAAVWGAARLRRHS